METLRLHSPDLSHAAATLLRSGRPIEAALLEEAGRLSRAERVWAQGRALTAHSRLYPPRWLRTLGRRAPPALWRVGNATPEPPLAISIVGSRNPSREATEAAHALARAVAERGGRIYSGGAAGIDSAAALGARRARPESLVVILPFGISQFAPEGEWAVSLVPPAARMTAASTHERNRLIYTASPVTVVFEPRLRVGGSWHGAEEALHRRLSDVYVCGQGPAAEALEALGADRYRRDEIPGDWLGRLQSGRASSRLFPASDFGNMTS